MSDATHAVQVMHLRWALGGEARVVAIRADAITLESTVPAPPGSRIDGALLAGSSRTLRVKIHLSRKEPTGLFRLEGRPIDLTREAREELARLVEPPGADRPPT